MTLIIATATRAHTVVVADRRITAAGAPIDDETGSSRSDCLRMQLRSAVELGETADRLAVVAAWWEAQYFTDQERAALALAEQVTALPVPESRTWDDRSLSEEQTSALAWLVTMMNAWNRVAIVSHYPIVP